MAFIAPVVLALLLNCTGIYMFSTQESYDKLPYMTYVIFLISIAFLLCNINLNPIAYTHMFPWADFVIEFVFAMLIMEFTASQFWFPLEVVVLTTLSRIPDLMVDLHKKFGLECEGLCGMLQILRLKESLVVVSYLISIFFFLCITHATQVVDFTVLISGGIAKFIEDMAMRGQKLYNKILE